MGCLIIVNHQYLSLLGFPGGAVVYHLPTNAEIARDASSIFSGSGRSLGAGQKMATHSSILALEMKWTEEHGGLQSMESQRVGHIELSHTHTLVYCKLTFLENVEFPLFPLSSCLVYIYMHAWATVMLVEGKRRFRTFSLLSTEEKQNSIVCFTL